MSWENGDQVLRQDGERFRKRKMLNDMFGPKMVIVIYERFHYNAKNDWENFGTLHCCLHVRGVVVHGSLIVLCLKRNHHVGMLTECNLSCLSPYL